MRQTYVYFIRAAAFVKIGHAGDPLQRMYDLQIGCPYKMELMGTVVCSDGPKWEARVHHRLRSYRLHGEWFVLSSDVERHVALILKYGLKSARVVCRDGRLTIPKLTPNLHPQAQKRA